MGGMNKPTLLYGSIFWMFWHMLMTAIAPTDLATPGEVLLTAGMVVATAIIIERLPRRQSREVEWEITEEDVWDDK